MKALKEALKNKMVKVVNIHIHEPNSEEQKTSDLAPDVDDPPGVETDKDSPEESMLETMISHTPSSPKGASTLQGKAKALMLEKMASLKKKELKPKV